MSIKDGFKFGIGYVLGQAVMVVLAKGIIKVCEKSLNEMKVENDENE